MIHQQSISAYISGLVVSVMLLMIPSGASAQSSKKKVKELLPDTTAFFNGFAVSVDLLGPGMVLLGGYGTYEGALRLNLKDRYFPIVEAGIGKADYEDKLMNNHYKTSAPFIRIGADFNLLKNKHDIYRLYAGARYGFTSFKFDLFHPAIKDPIWGNMVEYNARDVKCSYHWAEAVIGVDASIIGPLHLGWSIRYKKRLAHKDGELDNSWYVPGYGISDSSGFGGTVNLIVDI